MRFCVRGAWDEAKESCRFDPATGTVACAKGDPSLPLAACQRAFGGGGVVAREERFAGQEAHGARLLVIASDHVFGGMSTGAVVQPLRARGLVVHDAKCSPTGDYPWRYAHWGEGPDGERVFGAELLARLDTSAMRAALAGDLSLHESEESPYLLLDPTGGADALVVPTRGCALPPGPREHDGVLEFYTSRYAGNGPELRHCRVRLPSGRTMCGSVTPGTFCEAKR